MDHDVPSLRDQVLHRLHSRIVRNNRHATLGLMILPEFNNPIILRQNRRILRLPRFEQLGHPRKTSCDVSGFNSFSGNSSQHVTSLHHSAVFGDQDRVRRQDILRLDPLLELNRLPVLIHDLNCWPQKSRFSMLFIVHDHASGDPGVLVDHITNGHAINHIHELHDTVRIAEDRDHIRIPLDQALSLLDLVLISDEQLRSVLNVVRRPLLSTRVNQRQRPVTRQDNCRSPGC